MQTKKIAIIPARGGSKRIPRKNIKPFLGKPILVYSIETALKSRLFDEVMVSTDDKDIAEVAKKYGASVPFFRSEANSDDFATTVDVLLEVIERYEEMGEEFECYCCIYPTAPFVSVEQLKTAEEKLMREDLDAVFPVLPYSFPVQRSMKIEEGRVKMLYPEHMNTRSQDLEPIYHDAGQFYFSKTDVLKKEKKIWTDNTGCIVLNELEAQDIDNETDWKLAELKYQLRDAK